MPTHEPKKNVLVTRPAEQTANLSALLTEAGFQPILYPTIGIFPAPNPLVAQQVLSNLPFYNYVIFISPNAALQADLLLQQKWPSLGATTLVAIGPKTASTLNQLGQSPLIIANKPFNSEALLDQLPTHSKQLRCLIVKGQGGRQFLAEQLKKKGMHVSTLDVYSRGLPQPTQELSSKTISYVTITSQLALDNLYQLIPEKMKTLQQHATFVFYSQRIANYASQRGCHQCLISHEASDAGLVFALLNAKK